CGAGRRPPCGSWTPWRGSGRRPPSRRRRGWCVASWHPPLSADSRVQVCLTHGQRRCLREAEPAERELPVLRYVQDDVPASRLTQQLHDTVHLRGELRDVARVALRAEVGVGGSVAGGERSAASGAVTQIGGHGVLSFDGWSVEVPRRGFEPRARRCWGHLVV